MVVLALPSNKGDDLSVSCKVKRTRLQPVLEEDLLSSPLDLHGMNANGAQLYKRGCAKPANSILEILKALDATTFEKMGCAATELDLLKTRSDDLIRLWYSQEGSDDLPESRNNFAFVAGVHVHCPARVEIMSQRKDKLDKHVKFTVDPPLPEGLTLDRRTGLISGIASHSQYTSSTHLITMGVCASGKDGVRLGMLPLTTSTVVIAIEDTEELFSYYMSNGISC